MKLSSPAAERNRLPILEVLRDEFPRQGLVLEIASGSGAHAVFLARELTPLVWQPTDVSEEALASIREYRAEAGLLNLHLPLRLDVTEPDWPVPTASAMLCVNMLHISPWKAAEGLFTGAGKLLPKGAPLCTYGPYRFNGEFTSNSNFEFDQSLRLRNPEWGVREVRDLEKLAGDRGLVLARTVPLPANNHVLVFRRE